MALQSIFNITSTLCIPLSLLIYFFVPPFLSHALRILYIILYLYHCNQYITILGLPASDIGHYIRQNIVFALTLREAAKKSLFAATLRGGGLVTGKGRATKKTYILWKLIFAQKKVPLAPKLKGGWAGPLKYQLFLGFP